MNTGDYKAIGAIVRELAYDDPMPPGQGHHNWLLARDSLVRILADYMAADVKEQCPIVDAGGYCFTHQPFDRAKFMAACHGETIR